MKKIRSSVDMLGGGKYPEYLHDKQTIPNASLTTISNCGHFLQEDQPERLSELLVEFLSE